MIYGQSLHSGSTPSSFDQRAAKVGSHFSTENFLHVPAGHFTEPHDLVMLIVGVDGDQQEIEAEFDALKEKWLEETRHLSSPTVKYLHPSYARIIGLGQSAVPLLLNALESEPADWFYALRAITGENPVTEGMVGDIGQMTQAWLQWGRERGIL